MTSIEVTEDRVIIRRGGVNPQVIGLTFTAVLKSLCLAPRVVPRGYP